MTLKITRRKLLSLSLQASVIASARPLLASQSSGQGAKYQRAFQSIDSFVARYMREMNSPGMILALAERGKILRTTAYGFGDLALKQRVRPERLFHIGSISKSFTAIALLQLQAEGKLDLHKPIAEYLPWLRIESEFAPITTHHLLTHSASLPGNVPLSLSDPTAKHRAAFAPGLHFHYCNLGYDILGRLVSTLDRCSYGEAIRRRILAPLGMRDTAPAINSDSFDRTIKSYVPYHSERPYPRYGKLTAATELVFENAAGSIASTAHDMGLYVSMLANRGQGAKARVISEENFALMVKPHIKAAEFGPTASYGYGLAIDQLDGHTIARHTGGMVSFMSAMQIDLEEGVGAFASINAMQGYRPNPVAVYALKTLRATNAGKAPPPLPSPNPPTKIEKASDYAGIFTSPDGRKLEFKAEGNHLFLLYKNQRLPLETATEPGFIVQHSDFDRFLLRFVRAQGEKGAVTEVSYGADWYVNDKYAGPRDFSTPKEWEAFVGHYRNDSPWIGSVRVVRRKDKLWLDGGIPLEPIDANTFRLVDEPGNPEWIRFLDVINGEAKHLKYSGEDYWRVSAR